MRKLIFLLCIWGSCAAQSPSDTVTLGLGEYQLLAIKDGVLYGCGGGSTGQGTNTGPLGTMIQAQFANGTHPRVKYVGSNLHSAFCVVDSVDLQVYETGLNDGCIRGGCSLGATSNFAAIPGLTNVIQIWGSAMPGGIDTTAFDFFVKADGTLWRMGTKIDGTPGDGSNYAKGDDSVPVKVTFPAGTFIKSVTGMFMPMALDSAGNVWTWGGGGIFGITLGRTGTYLSPAKVTIPGGQRIIEIAGDGYVNYALGANGHLYAWGFYNSMMGMGIPFSSNGQINTPTDITTSQNTHGLTYLHIAKIHTSSLGIMSDSSVRSWGDNPEGSVGFGNQLNYFTTTNAFEWDESRGDNVVDTLVNPLPCVRNAMRIYNGGYYVLYNFVQTFDNQMWFAGRNKNGIGCCDVDGDASGNIEAQYPDSWNDTVFRRINMWATANWKVQSPWCIAHPTALYCPNYAPPTDNPPTVNAGSNQSIPVGSTTVTGTATGNTGAIEQVYWSSASCGPMFSSPFSASSGVSNLSVGPNTLIFKATDQYGKTNTSTVIVTYNLGCNCYFITNQRGYKKIYH